MQTKVCKSGVSVPELKPVCAAFAKVRGAAGAGLRIFKVHTQRRIDARLAYFCARHECGVLCPEHGDVRDTSLKVAS